MATKRHLGRGLSALLGGDEAVEAPGAAGQRLAPIEHLHPGRYQPRGIFNEEALEQLAQSIREQGILQPILVRAHPDKDSEFEIVAGERRWRAAQLAKLHEVPIILRELSNRDTLEIALIENVQREDLNPLEEAEAYRRLVQEFRYSHDELGERIGKSRPYIANILRLLELPKAVQKMISDGSLSASHARALIGLDDAVELARKIVEKGLSVREAELLARPHKPKSGKAAPRPKAPAHKDADTKALERDLSNRLGLKVEIDFDGKAGGTLTVSYKTLDQLDDLIAKLSR